MGYESAHSWRRGMAHHVVDKAVRRSGHSAPPGSDVRLTSDSRRVWLSDGLTITAENLFVNLFFRRSTTTHPDRTRPSALAQPSVITRDNASSTPRTLTRQDATSSCSPTRHQRLSRRRSGDSPEHVRLALPTSSPAIDRSLTHHGRLVADLPTTTPRWSVNGYAFDDSLHQVVRRFGRSVTDLGWVPGEGEALRDDARHRSWASETARRDQVLASPGRHLQRINNDPPVDASP